jgi:hypothetical protein
MFMLTTHLGVKCSINKYNDNLLTVSFKSEN